MKELKDKLEKYLLDFKKPIKTKWQIYMHGNYAWEYIELAPYGDSEMEGITIGLTNEYGTPTAFLNAWGFRGNIHRIMPYGISHLANKIHWRNLGTLHSFKMTFPNSKYFWQDQMEEPLSPKELALILRSDKQYFVQNYQTN